MIVIIIAIVCTIVIRMVMVKTIILTVIVIKVLIVFALATVVETYVNIKCTSNSKKTLVIAILVMLLVPVIGKALVLQFRTS